MTAHAPGWYGKLASLGDFAHRRLSPEWIERCDRWLSGVLQDSRAILGDRWLDAYLTAPLLRFAWAPGIVDERWWFGVWMASCDNVGRYFPLIVAQSRSRPPTDGIALDHLELWTERVGHAAAATLNDAGASIDAMEAALADLPPWPAPSAARGTSVAEDADAVVVASRGRISLAALVEDWTSHDMTARLAGCSAWWHVDAADGRHVVEVVPGLPDGARFARMLDSGGARPGAAAGGG